MPTLISVPALGLQDSSPLRMTDVSFLSRLGVKGGGAANWLKTQNFPVPEPPNTWDILPQGGLIARLGIAEFLIEDPPQGNWVTKLLLVHPLPPRVTPFLRQDLAIALSGSAVYDLLSQACNIDVQSLDLSRRPVIKTSLSGIPITILLGEQDGKPLGRIWCDATFRADVWQALDAIAQAVENRIFPTIDIHSRISSVCGRTVTLVSKTLP